MKGQIAFKKSRGRHWGLTPFGCRREEVTGALSPSAETYRDNGHERAYYDSLRRCYELYATGDFGFDTLAGALNDDGWRFRDRQGQPRLWDRNNVRSAVALCRVYEGWVPVQGAAKGRPRQWVQANYEPVLPVELCRQVERVWGERSIERQPMEPPNVRDSIYTLTGILYCGECGQLLKGSKSRRSHVRQYRHTRLRRECHQVLPLAADVEAQAVALLECLVLPDELVAVIAEMMRPEPEEPDERDRECARLRVDLESRQVEIERLVELAISTDLGAEVYRRQLAKLNEAARRLGERIAVLEAAIAAERDPAGTVEQRIRALAQTVATVDATAQRGPENGFPSQLLRQARRAATWATMSPAQYPAGGSDANTCVAAA